MIQDNLKIYIDYTASFIEVAGVLTILIGTTLAMVKFLIARQGVPDRSYKLLRKELGKAILLGLEILVAGDIIATVVTEPTMRRVLVLGVIVVIRTFLSWSIQMEIEGTLPWNKAEIGESSNHESGNSSFMSPRE